MHILPTPDGFELWLESRLLARHSAARPFAEIGIGHAHMAMYRGNFDITDEVTTRHALTHAKIDGTSVSLSSAQGTEPLLVLELAHNALIVSSAAPSLNRFWFHLHAEPSEHIWGCGEQMSYFDLRGRRFPLWTSEPGVGRDKSTAITKRADAEGRAGGDYHTTNYPQPTFLTSRKLAVHLQTTAYSVFDFTAPDEHVLEVWAVPDRLEFFAANNVPDLVTQLSTRFGRPPRLPDWIMSGAVIGLKEGLRSFERLETFLAAGTIVSALWCEDWSGVRQTSFGTRLFWDWHWNPARYPDLPARIKALSERGIRFMGYTNPYLCTDGTQFPEAEALGLLARNAHGETYHVDFGEFDCGIVDFTLPAARQWFAETIIQREMLDLGMSGWMADFGEYLPVDAHLHGGDAMLLHNAWPTIWAEVNATATANHPEAVFFMRAGFTGVQKHNRLLWAGDQCVDFSRHDGIGTVITGALSSGLLGTPYHHSDIGGYTSLFGLTRTPELMQRWTEMAAFTPVMRTHEGNRPRDNLQFDEDALVLAHFARFTRLHAALLPLLKRLADEAVATGLPMQRPLFLHFPDDESLYGEQTTYLLGPDLLIAPVLEAGRNEWRVKLPPGCNWVHLWSGKTQQGGQTITIPAPIGQPPVFWREGSQDEALFRALPSPG